MKEFFIDSGRIHIKIHSIVIGEDLCIIVSGGDKPHIGSVCFSVVSGKLKQNKNGEVMLEGHKDNLVIRQISQEVSKKLHKNVLVAGGIHIHNIKSEEIDFILDSLQGIIETITSECEA